MIWIQILNWSKQSFEYLKILCLNDECAARDILSKTCNGNDDCKVEGTNSYMECISRINTITNATTSKCECRNKYVISKATLLCGEILVFLIIKKGWGCLYSVLLWKESLGKTFYISTKSLRGWGVKFSFKFVWCVCISQWFVLYIHLKL